MRTPALALAQSGRLLREIAPPPRAGRTRARRAPGPARTSCTPSTSVCWMVVVVLVERTTVALNPRKLQHLGASCGAGRRGTEGAAGVGGSCSWLRGARRQVSGSCGTWGRPARSTNGGLGGMHGDGWSGQWPLQGQPAAASGAARPHGAGPARPRARGWRRMRAVAPTRRPGSMAVPAAVPQHRRQWHTECPPAAPRRRRCTGSHWRRPRSRW